MSEKNEIAKPEELVTLKQISEIIVAQPKGSVTILPDHMTIRKVLENLVEKAKDQEVTKENLKDCKLVERDLREIRYLFQKIKTNNTAYYNDKKKDDAKVWDDLVEFIEPFEKNHKEKITAIEQAEKKAKEEAEAKRLEKEARIDAELREIESKLQEILLSKNDESLVEYDRIIQDLDLRSEEFEAKEFEANKICQIYRAKRPMLVKQIEEEKDRMKRESDIEAREFALRKEKRTFELEKLGFETKSDESLYFNRGDDRLLKSDILAMPEESFLKMVEKQKELLKTISEKGVEAAKAGERIARFGKGVGIGVAAWINGDKVVAPPIKKEENVEIMSPTTNETVEEITVKQEITPFMNAFLGQVSLFKSTVINSEFKNEKSREAIEALIDGIEKAVNVALGDEM